MLELKNIKKTYRIGDIETKALDGVSTAFREKEFVAILGTSGSGKTTCLNVIGGLDKYDEGDLIIKGKSTKYFRAREWDAYRNNSIGFVFQSYNLITHISIVANVELGMTLSGVSAAEKRVKALEVLKRVGLEEHLHKKPNQLSGGQMQRVAIARALANDPEILLCDEPTGALDTNTSVQIMDLIKEVASDKLVIMVTHNSEIAHTYADRIIEFKDGQIISDSHPHVEREKEDMFKIKKTSMNFLTALSLSFNNLKTKKGRTFLTSFASSIGIIGIAVILSLSSGFRVKIDEYQRDAMTEFPIIITSQMTKIDYEALDSLRKDKKKLEFKPTDEVKLYDNSENFITHKNIFNTGFEEYIKKIPKEICMGLSYISIASLNGVTKSGDKTVPVMLSSLSGMKMNTMSGMSGMGISAYPTMLDESNGTYLERYYDLLAGEYPKEITDVVLVIETTNEADIQTMTLIGFNTIGIESIKFDDIVGKEYRIVMNNDFYVKIENDMGGRYMPNLKYNELYDLKDNITIRISGVVRAKESTKMPLLAAGISYSDKLNKMIVERNINSDIVKDQQASGFNVLTGEKIDEDTKSNLISVLGGNASPYGILVFPTSFEGKDGVIDYIGEYNAGKTDEEKITYTDLAATLSEMTGGIIDAITIVLIAFAGISLVVSLIMICIITYTSVIERTKEIGILKALGARKKDITRVFDAETCILGVFSGLLGVGTAWILTFPINRIIYNMTELKGVAALRPDHAILLIIISTLLTMLGGHIPARMASKKDAVEALRSE